MRLRRRWWLLALVVWAATPAHADDPARAAQTAAHMLDYVSVDYSGAVQNGNVIEPDEYQEQVEFTGQVAMLLRNLPEKPQKTQLMADADALVRLVAQKAAGEQVSRAASRLRWAIVTAYQIAVAPKIAPDLARAQALYRQHCVSCHGANGRGDGPAANALDPKPSNFHDRARMAQRSAYGLYNTISLGVAGTAMAGFSGLTEAERWALAFYVSGFPVSADELAKGKTAWDAGTHAETFTDLASIATLSPEEVTARSGADAMLAQYWLRAHPEALAAVRPAPIEFAIAGIGKSLEAYRRGARSQATRLAIHAYFEGYELVEPNLKSVDAELMTRTEREMIAYRGLLQSGAATTQVEQQAALVQSLLAEARTKLDNRQMSDATAFTSALVVLLREGAEAILMLAGILAFLTKSGRPDARRWVHFGWIAALMLGMATWAVSSYLVDISGASREITEGVTSLISAAMLIYVGYWLHTKSHAIAWQRFIKDNVGSALSTGTVWMLATISFLAIYREIFETVLFYQALAAQAGPEGHGALFAGLGVAILLLIAIAWTLLRASVTLPIGLFFSVSGMVLVVLAVIFTGQGIAALQKAGQVSVSTVPFVTVPLLGIYPTVESLLAQLAVIIVIAMGFWWTRRPEELVTDDI